MSLRPKPGDTLEMQIPDPAVKIDPNDSPVEILTRALEAIRGHVESDTRDAERVLASIGRIARIALTKVPR